MASAASIAPVLAINKTTTDVIAIATTKIPVVIGNVTDLALAKNATIDAAATVANSSGAQLTVVDFFIKVIRGELLGARKCKHNHDCGAGLKCNALWHWCAPLDAPEWLEIGNNHDLYFFEIFSVKFLRQITSISRASIGTMIYSDAFSIG